MNLCELGVSAVKQTLPQRRRDAEGWLVEEVVNVNVNVNVNNC